MTVDFSRVERPHVLQALAEYDELGGEVFLDTYGFKPARTYLLVHDEKSYDSKAILGVAHRYAKGVAATSDDFSGGLDGAVKWLEALDFEIHTSTPERDASEVGSEAARAAWTEAARPVLLEAAGRYRALVTYKQLAAAVQESTGITTTQLMHQWIGDVLGRVTDDCQSRSEPLLSSLCVTVQGSVGQGYAEAVERARGTRPTDPDEHAANERLECYRHWKAEGLPRDGGTPLRTAHFTPVRRAAPRKATVPKPKAAKAPARKTVVGRPTSPEAKPAERICPTCFTEMPPSGVCYYCE